MGVIFFKGQFNYCEYEHIKDLFGFSNEFLETKWDCLNYGGEYVLRDSSFDHIGASLDILFHIS